jgi:hypothetical protein
MCKCSHSPAVHTSPLVAALRRRDGPERQTRHTAHHRQIGSAQDTVD